jgi:hypothetical protein
MTINTLTIDSSFTIVEGPNREGLFDSFRLGQSTLRFIMKLEHPNIKGLFYVHVDVWAIERKDLAQSWKLKAYFGTFNNSFDEIITEVENYNQLFEVHYNTSSRKGGIFRELDENPRGWTNEPVTVAS